MSCWSFFDDIQGACTVSFHDWAKLRSGGLPLLCFSVCSGPQQHTPTKMILLIPAVSMFMRRDVQPALNKITMALTKEREIDSVRR